MSYSMKPGQKVAYGPSHVGDRVIARIVPVRQEPARLDRGRGFIP
jgi:hypothetical protein